MSQHIFNTEYEGNQVTILMGYDRPLDGYFMVIERVVPAQDSFDEEVDFEDDDYIYSNLYEVESHPKSLARYQQKLTELSIDVPVQMLEEIIEDRAQRVGNKLVHHAVINGVYSRNPA